MVILKYNTMRLTVSICALLLLVQGISSAYAQDTECEIDEFFGYERTGLGYDRKSFEAAEKKARDNMHVLAVELYPEKCGAEPVVLCTKRSTERSGQHDVYKVQVRFVCPLDEGVVVNKPMPQRVTRTHIFKGRSHYELNRDVQPYLEQMAMEECGVERISDEAVFRFKTDLVGRSNRHKENFSPEIWDWEYKLSLQCPAQKPTVTIDPSVKGAKDSPDPKINWRYQNKFSDDSPEAAKAKVDAAIARLNVCRMRGGAVDITYKEEKRDYYYWATARYRCRYD